MIPASCPRDDPRTTRLLHIDPRHDGFSDRTIGDLRVLLEPNDLLVVNDAATLPASLRGSTESGEPIEARLLGANDEHDDGRWRAVLFGAGDWRTRTEERALPPHFSVGDTLRFDGLSAVIAKIDDLSPRLVSLTFNARNAELWRALYRVGRPVQYAYTSKPLALWHVQTVYAARPWAVEAPSAGFALTWDLLLDLRRRGVGIVGVTHAAGLSSTGDQALDSRLPFAERYDVSDYAVQAIEATKKRGGRVVAVGTTVVRALEGAAANGGGQLVASKGMTEILLSANTRCSVVDGIVTGVHESGTSHFTLLEAFAPRLLLDRAHAFASMHGYLRHEFGDAILIICRHRL